MDIALILHFPFFTLHTPLQYMHCMFFYFVTHRLQSARAGVAEPVEVLQIGVSGFRELNDSLKCEGVKKSR